MDESQDLRVLQSHVDPWDLEVSAGSNASLDHGNLLEMVVVKAPSDDWSSAVALARAEAVKIIALNRKFYRFLYGVWQQNGNLPMHTTELVKPFGNARWADT